MHVLVDEIVDDMLFKRLSEINNMVLKTKLFRIMLGLHNGVDAATAAFFGNATLFNAVEGAEGGAHQLVALLQKEHCRNGTVDTATHGHQNPLFAHQFPYFCERQKYDK